MASTPDATGMPNTPRQSRSISITFHGIAPEQYKQTANGLWAVLQTAATLGGFGFAIKHDGDDDLTHELNGDWARDTRTTWT